MTLKTMLLSSASMTAAELSKGRFMRAPDGHDDAGFAASTPAPAEPAAPAPAPALAAEPAEGEVTADSLEAEFGSGDGEPATPNADEVDPNPDEPGKEPKGASVEERIAEITAKQREAERDGAEARRLLAEATAKLDALAPPAKGPDMGDPDAAPDPASYDYGEADPKFIADTARFHARQEFQLQQREAEMKVQFSDMEAKWQGEIAKPEVLEKYPDFQTKVVEAADAGSWDCSPLMAVGIKQSPVGADVAYHLASDPAEAARISRLSPIEQALEFGRIEGRFMHAPAPMEKKPNIDPKAPTPPTTARGAGGKFAVAADTEDFSAFEKTADAIIAKKQ